LKRAALVAAMGIALALGGCEAIVPADVADPLHCTEEGRVGPPACRAGQYCRASACTACLPGEICGDGIDDDCDGRVDQGCSDGGAPDASTPDPIGAPCTSACGGELACVDLAALGVDDATPICSRPCCTSADCGDPRAGAVCWPVPHGGGVCRRAADVGRAAPGAVRSGMTCSRDDDCRSASCDAENGVCADTCCSDASCPAAARPACVLREDAALAPGRVAWSCGPMPGKGDFLHTCRGDADCRSGYCAKFGTFQLCTRPCCNSDQCGEIAIPFLGTYRLACGYGEHDGQRVRACVDAFMSGAPKAVGRTCQSNDECRGDVCLAVDDDSVCTDACCTDVDCGDSEAFACRPLDAGSGSVLRCAPR
jgi:hypothetical protein